MSTQPPPKKGLRTLDQLKEYLKNNEKNTRMLKVMYAEHPLSIGKKLYKKETQVKLTERIFGENQNVSSDPANPISPEKPLMIKLNIMLNEGPIGFTEENVNGYWDVNKKRIHDKFFIAIRPTWDELSDHYDTVNMTNGVDKKNPPDTYRDKRNSYVNSQLEKYGKKSDGEFVMVHNSKVENELAEYNLEIMPGEVYLIPSIISGSYDSMNTLMSRIIPKNTTKTPTPGGKRKKTKRALRRRRSKATMCSSRRRRS
jgi:hypothetical protein